MSIVKIAIEIHFNWILTTEFPWNLSILRKLVFCLRQTLSLALKRKKEKEKRRTTIWIKAIYLYLSAKGESLPWALFSLSSWAKSKLICLKAEKPAQFHSTITPYSPLIQAQSIFNMLHTLLIYPLSSKFRPDGGNQLSPLPHRGGKLTV